MTSYSRLKRDQELSRDAFTGEAHDQVWTKDEQESGSIQEHEASQRLPGGAKTGTFLHFVLEHLAYTTALGLDERGFGEHPDVREWIERGIATHGMKSEHAASTEAILFRTLTSSITVEGCSLPAGLCALENYQTEVDFLYPLPESTHPRLGDVRASSERRPFEVGRGFVRGVIDLVFEHEGKVFVLDWKSDRLRDFRASCLQRHVDDHYGLQVELYTLGIARMLGIESKEDYQERFGGMFYCYLRGMRANSGLHFVRPSFETVCDWEEKYQKRDASTGVGV